MINKDNNVLCALAFGLESYMIAEEGIAEDISAQNKKDAKIAGGVILGTLLFSVGYTYTAYKNEQRKKKEHQKQYAERLKEYQKEWDEIYDKVNRIHISMYNDISKMVSKLNNQKIIKEIENDIKSDYKDDPDLIKSLLDDVYVGMFSMSDTALPLSKELSKKYYDGSERFTITRLDVSTSVCGDLYHIYHNIASVIGAKYKINITVDEDYGALEYYAKDLAVNIR